MSEDPNDIRAVQLKGILDILKLHIRRGNVSYRGPAYEAARAHLNARHIFPDKNLSSTYVAFQNNFFDKKGTVKPNG